MKKRALAPEGRYTFVQLEKGIEHQTCATLNTLAHFDTDEQRVPTTQL
jgi:hypothetical protein